MEKKDTSWQKSAKWYGEIVGEKGHFFHQTLVIPGVLRLLDIRQGDRLLDVACGQGVLARRLPGEVTYLGVDLSHGLLADAKRMDKNKKHKYIVADVTKSIPVAEKYNKAAIVLALQNIKEPEQTIKLTGEKMDKGGKLCIVLNHPCFRIPRQSSWEVDPKNKLQSRKINRYMSPMEIPINMHPGDKSSPVTWSYHLPLESYSEMLFENGFLIEKIEEWTSEKKSEGKMAKSENRAREEFPLFMAITAVRK
ncbi:MAG TPA: methyltransferase domain-containing protein [Candidatus Woesebacteria bacterium]|nr:methyltransferase domain-containing protein [Candidatus Woesebacteria bacterium]